MTIEKLKKEMLDNANDVWFICDGKESGVESEVVDSIFSFRCWYGRETKTFRDFDSMITDKFFGDKSLIDLMKKVEFNFY